MRATRCGAKPRGRLRFPSGVPPRPSDIPRRREGRLRAAERVRRPARRRLRGIRAPTWAVLTAAGDHPRGSSTRSPRGRSWRSRTTPGREDIGDGDGLSATGFRARARQRGSRWLRDRASSRTRRFPASGSYEVSVEDRQRSRANSAKRPIRPPGSSTRGDARRSRCSRIGDGGSYRLAPKISSRMNRSPLECRMPTETFADFGTYQASRLPRRASLRAKRTGSSTSFAKRRSQRTRPMYPLMRLMWTDAMGRRRQLGVTWSEHNGSWPRGNFVDPLDRPG